MIILFGCIGISYAIWVFTASQTNPNKLASNCLNIEVTNETEEIHLENSFPLTDEEGMKTAPYTFTIKNTCDTFIDYEISLGITNQTTLDSQYVAVVLDYNEIKTLNTYESTTIDGYKEGRILQKGSLSEQDEVTYNLRLWLDEDVTVNDPVFNTTFSSKIIVTATIGSYNPVEQGFTKLADAMLVNEYQSTSVEDAKERIANKQTPDFTKTAPIIDWSENHASNTSTVSATMPHPDLVGTGGIAANINATNILPRIGTGYTFNSETGRYNLTNSTYLDPTTLDYNGETKYYYCGSGFNTNASDLISPYGNYADCTSIYQIVGATASDSTTTGAGGTSIKTKIYRMTAHTYTQSERESDKSDKGLYTMEDEYGTSYYYRGSVTNNYVYFGGFYWRIIRLNGDGSIRLLYAGTSPDATGSGLQIRGSAFNSTRDNPGYVGYMYGSIFNSSYAETNAMKMIQP